MDLLTDRNQKYSETSPITVTTSPREYLLWAGILWPTGNRVNRPALDALCISAPSTVVPSVCVTCSSETPYQ